MSNIFFKSWLLLTGIFVFISCTAKGLNRDFPADQGSLPETGEVKNQAVLPADSLIYFLEEYLDSFDQEYTQDKSGHFRIRINFITHPYFPLDQLLARPEVELELIHILTLEENQQDLSLRNLNRLPALEQLNIASLTGKSILELAAPDSLKILRIKQSDLEQLPDLSNLSRLEELQVAQTPIQSLGQSFPESLDLKRLDISNNKKLQDISGLAGLTIAFLEIDGKVYMQNKSWIEDLFPETLLRIIDDGTDLYPDIETLSMTQLGQLNGFEYSGYKMLEKRTGFRFRSDSSLEGSTSQLIMTLPGYALFILTSGGKVLDHLLVSLKAGESMAGDQIVVKPGGYRQSDLYGFFMGQRVSRIFEFTDSTIRLYEGDYEIQYMGL